MDSPYLTGIEMCPPCLIDLEACGGARYRTRESEELATKSGSLPPGSSNHTVKAARMTTTIPKRSNARISGTCQQSQPIDLSTDLASRLLPLRKLEGLGKR